MLKYIILVFILNLSLRSQAYWGTDYGIWTYKISLVRSEICKFTNPKNRRTDCIKLVKAFAKEEDLKCNGMAEKDRKNLTNLVGECSNKIKTQYKVKAKEQRVNIDWEKEISSKHYQEINVIYPDIKWNFWLIQKIDLNGDLIVDHAFLGSNKFRYCIGIIYSKGLKPFKKCFKKAPRKPQNMKVMPLGPLKEFCGEDVKLIQQEGAVGLSDGVCKPFFVLWSKKRKKFY